MITLCFQYLRCDIKTDVADLGTLLLRKWCLPDPNLLISVFGGHSKFDSKVIGRFTWGWDFSSLNCDAMPIKWGLCICNRNNARNLTTQSRYHGYDSYHDYDGYLGYDGMIVYDVNMSLKTGDGFTHQILHSTHNHYVFHAFNKCLIFLMLAEKRGQHCMQALKNDSLSPRAIIKFQLRVICPRFQHASQNPFVRQNSIAIAWLV